MIEPGIDGVDHINIYSKGTTALGRWLSNFAYEPIQTEYGAFASIEAYWYWLGCEDDRLRYLHGYQAKQEGRKIERPIKRENFEELIKAAIDIKLKTNRAMMLELAHSTLPLCHYYDYKGKQIDAGFEWIVEHISDRRKQLQLWLKRKESRLNS